MIEYKMAEASIFGKRIVCGECGFRIAEFKEEQENKIEFNNVITVLCRRRDESGIPCNTINKIKV